MSRIILPSCSDFVFKLIFGDRRNADSLAAFLRSVLDLPAEEYGSLAIVGPHLKREGFDDKPGVLDVKMNTKSGEVTDAEIQVENVPQMRERLVFYAARMNGARAEGWKAGITEGEEKGLPKAGQEAKPPLPKTCSKSRYPSKTFPT